MRKEKFMEKLRLALWVAAFFAVPGLLACNDKDTDEKQTSVSKAVAGQQTTTQKPAEKSEAEEGEEGEEGPANPASVAAEKSAPLQTSGKQFVYNCDNDTTGQSPAKLPSEKNVGVTQEQRVGTLDQA